MKASNREKIKTIVLFMLVFSSLFLTYRLWFKDHNLFSILGIFQHAKSSLKSQQVLENIYLPPKILINLGESSHILMTTKDEEYGQLQKEAVSIMRQVLSLQNYETLEGKEWNDILSSKSVLFGYEARFDSKMMLKLFNIQNSSIETGIAYISEILIVQDNTVSENIKCFIKDTENNKIYKFKFSYDDTNLKYLLSKVEAKDTSNYITGYELKHKLLSDNVLLLPTDEVIKARRVKLENEIDIESNSQVKNVAQQFFEKINIVKNIEYKSEDNQDIIQKEFIDRKRILRIFKNGLIEYTSAELPNDKIQIDSYSALKTAINFIDSNLALPKDFYISEIRRTSDASYYFGFDYLIEGLRVKTDGQNLPRHAIEIEVKGDIVTSYRRFVKNHDALREREVDVINLKAIDQAILKYRQKTGKKDINKAVSQISLVYVDNGANGSEYPSWYIVIDGEEFLINSMNEES